jgi:hypothetical protein
MRRVVMWNLVTLDGFFEGPKSWDIDWHEHVWGEELEQLSLEQLRTAWPGTGRPRREPSPTS